MNTYLPSSISDCAISSTQNREACVLYPACMSVMDLALCILITRVPAASSWHIPCTDEKIANKYFVINNICPPYDPCAHIVSLIEII